jgi:hypothetical protein
MARRVVFVFTQILLLVGYASNAVARHLHIEQQGHVLGDE